METLGGSVPKGPGPPVSKRGRSAVVSPAPQKSAEEAEAISQYRQIVDKLRGQITTLRDKLGEKKE